MRFVTWKEIKELGLYPYSRPPTSTLWKQWLQKPMNSFAMIVCQKGNVNVLSTSPHGAVFAKSGHGKTQTLRTIIRSFLEEDDPPALFIIDSLGALIRGLDRLEIFATKLKDRLVIIDPADTPALNFFKLESDDLHFYLFKAVDQAFTQRQATMISYLMELMHHTHGATLETLVALCEGRAEPDAEAMQRVSPFAQSFFANQFFAKKPDQLVQQTKQQIAQRIYTLVRLPKFNQMFSASENAFDPYHCMQEKKIVLINTDGRPTRLGGLGEAGSSVLGRFLLAQILDAARGRPDDARHLALIILDEAKHYMDDQAALILSDARQFGLGMLLATQFPHQLEEGVRREINTNTSIKLFGPVEYAVASQYARDMFTTPEFIMGMKSYDKSHAEWACYVANFTPHAMKLSVPFGSIEQMPTMDDLTWRAMRDRNRKRYGASPLPPPYKPPGPTTTHHRTQVSFPEFKVTLPALLDSGAYMTVVPTAYEINGKVVRFTLGGVSVERPLLRMQRLSSFTDAVTEHPVVSVIMQIGDHIANEEIALSHKGEILVGRTFMSAASWSTPLTQI